MWSNSFEKGIRFFLEGRELVFFWVRVGAKGYFLVGIKNNWGGGQKNFGGQHIFWRGGEIKDLGGMGLGLTFIFGRQEIFFLVSSN